MTGSPQLYEMLIDLRERELRRISVHRIAALDGPGASDGVRTRVAGALVRIGMRLDGNAARDIAARAPVFGDVPASDRCAHDAAAHW